MPRQTILVIAGVVYSLAAAVSITTGLRHYELLVIGLQILLLLPAFVYFLDRNSDGEVCTWSESNGSWKQSRRLWICVLGFVICALFVSYHVSQSITFADEGSYQFQAKVFASLKAVGDAPPGSAANPVQTPWPLAYRHLILFHSGWFSKYPIGWPAVLALPEKLSIGWAATPVLGGMLLILVGEMAREAFGAALVLPAIWIAVFSPYTLAQCVGRLSHALCAVLIAAACGFCLRGIRRQSLAQFTLMFQMLVLSFHVRPFSAFIASAVLGSMTIWYCRRDRRLVARVAIVAAGFALLAVVSVLFYNRVYTGNLWLSPYALYDGRTVPKDIGITPSIILQNLLWTRRFSVQTTLLYAFPFVFALAAYGFWIERRSPAAQVLASLFPAIFIAHFAQTFTSSPVVGERYYFEAYSSVAVLAARGLQGVILKWRSSRQVVISALVMLTGIQGVMSAVAIHQIAAVGLPYREVSKLAERYRNCRCAVFLKSSPDLLTSSANLFDSRDMNLNSPAWKSAAVFYLNDPGPDQRPAWASRLGWNRWAVLGYDEKNKAARLELNLSDNENTGEPDGH